jgi:hypothetical protein
MEKRSGTANRTGHKFIRGTTLKCAYHLYSQFLMEKNGFVPY